jgi:hypothetical protein
MGAFQVKGGIAHRPVPPFVKQPQVEVPGVGTRAISATCWAAALSSWLKVARNVDWSVDELVNRFKPHLNNDALDLKHVKDVAESGFVQMDWEMVRGSDLTWDYLYDKLKYSYVYAMIIDSVMGHAVVVWGITRDSAGAQDIHLMDPKDGLRESALGQFQRRSPSCVVGWTKEATKWML